jgi:hypothetical protein
LEQYFSSYEFLKHLKDFLEIIFLIYKKPASPAQQVSRLEGRTQMVHISRVSSGISLSGIDVRRGSVRLQGGGGGRGVLGTATSESGTAVVAMASR